MFYNEVYTEYFTVSNEGQAMSAAKACFDNWLSNNGESGNHEERQIIKQVQGFIQAHGSSRFSDWDSQYHERVPNRVGFYRKSEDCHYVHAALFEREVCGPFSKKQVSQVLWKLQQLQTNNGFQLRVNSTDRDKKGYFYCIKGDILNLSP